MNAWTVLVICVVTTDLVAPDRYEYDTEEFTDPDEIKNTQHVPTENTTIEQNEPLIINKTVQKLLAKELLKKNALSSSFDKVASEKLFVDKSYFIKDLFKTKSKVVLITRPPRWGKTLLLDMVKNFFNIEMDSLGEKLPRAKMLQPRMFHGMHGRDALYKRLAISNSVMCKKLGEYPVIYLDLAGITGRNESEVLWSLYDKIDPIFMEQFKHLNETSYLHNMDDEHDIKLEFNRFFNRGVLEYTEFKKGLTFLSKILFKSFHNQVILLVDNYDKSLLEMYLKYGPNHEASKTLRKGLSDLLKKSLKHNIWLRKAIVMGVFPCAKYDLLNKVDVLDCNVFNDNLGRDLGFNKYDLFELLGHMSSKRLESIEEFYLGYSHGNKTRLASPYSIMNLLVEDGDIRSYWADKDDIDIFHKALKTYYKHDYRHLMSGKNLRNLYLSQKLNLSEIIQPENLIEMLIYNGYLTAYPSEYKLFPRKKIPGQNQTYVTITYHNVSLPNKEILYAFHKASLRETNETVQV